jgi:hypothetical protein
VDIKPIVLVIWILNLGLIYQTKFIVEIMSCELNNMENSSNQWILRFFMCFASKERYKIDVKTSKIDIAGASKEKDRNGKTVIYNYQIKY